jgi:energy-coupling factor transporter ATP-binding protein EcfA2
MQKLLLKFINCYGIKKLEYNFDFSNGNTYAVYAPNGVMKTSFSKTFKDFAKNQESRDLVFTERVSERVIQTELGGNLLPQAVFVIEPYNEQFNSDKLSTLLVKRELKAEYDQIYQDLEKDKKDFITKLKNISRSTNCEAEFVDTFITNKKDNLFDILNAIYPNIVDSHFQSEFKYNDVFDAKGNVKKFLDKHKDSLDLYIKNYELLISRSDFFKKSDNSFGTYQAGEVLKAVKDGSFFDAGHSLGLNNRTKIDSSKSFEKIVEDEINKVLEDEDLKKSFNKIDDALGSNAELRAFKKVVEKNNLLLIELKNYDEFKRKVWLSYLKELKNDVCALIESYNSRKNHLERIIKEAINTKTVWEHAVEVFNDRFNGLPFKLRIQNKEDVILRINEPVVEFVFFDFGEEKPLEKNDLLQVLSQGERRPLYILNVIFEVEARKEAGQETIFIIDDIADSFDYKNKYAIIEYLKDISVESFFHQLILTHNFDFFRTIQSRLSISRDGHCLMVEKTKEEIKFVNAEYLVPPFKWIEHLDDDKKLIASIPFVRNLFEYTRGKSDVGYVKLTSLLHIKSGSDSISISDLGTIYKNIFPALSVSFADGGRKIVDLIYNLADSCLTAAEGINLENKIILAIAIRLKAEKFMISKLSDNNEPSANQTIEYFERYKKEFGETEPDIIKSLEQVNLMTPENIHFNSFMYEPILDMSDEHLRNLYREISQIEKTTSDEPIEFKINSKAK